MRRHIPHIRVNKTSPIHRLVDELSNITKRHITYMINASNIYHIDKMQIKINIYTPKTIADMGLYQLSRDLQRI